MTLAEKQRQMICTINAMGDCFDQYSFLLLKAGQLSPMPDEHKTDDRLVAGCQSKVWLKLTVIEGCFYMEADSDTLILRGVLAVLSDLLNGAPAADVAALPITLLQETELSATFTSTRSSGLSGILETIRAACTGDHTLL